MATAGVRIRSACDSWGQAMGCLMSRRDHKRGGPLHIHRPRTRCRTKSVLLACRRNLYYCRACWCDAQPSMPSSTPRGRPGITTVPAGTTRKSVASFAKTRSRLPPATPISTAMCSMSRLAMLIRPGFRGGIKSRVSDAACGTAFGRGSRSRAHPRGHRRHLSRYWVTLGGLWFWHAVWRILQNSIWQVRLGGLWFRHQPLATRLELIRLR